MMCTTTNSAIQAARVREEKQTLLTKPRRVGSGGHAGREQSRAPHAGRRRALRPAPEVSLGSQCPRVGLVVRRICRSASAERAGPPGPPRAGRSARYARSTRAPTCREQA